MSISKSRTHLAAGRSAEMLAQRAAGQRIDLRKLALTGQAVSGELDLSLCERLADQLSASAGTRVPIAYRITGGQDTHGWPIVTIALGGVVPLVCQRCLQPFDYRLESESTVRLAASEDELAAWDAEDVEAMLATVPVERQELLEDEILLALPYAPIHQPEECPGGAQEIEEKGDDARKPFDALARLKRGNL